MKQLKTQIKDIEQNIKDINGLQRLSSKNWKMKIGRPREENEELKIENALLKGEEKNGI